MTQMFRAVLASTILAGSFAIPEVRAQSEGDKQLGSVHFQTSCNEVAQRRFDRAMRYQHSFWYSQSREIFDQVLQADPSCAIAHWGIALSLLLNPHNDTLPEHWPAGLAALRQGKALGPATERERDYIDTLLVIYTDHDTLDRGSRIQKYVAAASALAAKYPDDDEAQINYAITLNVAASPSDKTFADQLKGAAILEPLFKKYPHHPGIAHYLIHLYDYPAIANNGLAAAQSYAAIAPAAPHAQHMPSHIFTRVGFWTDSIASNLASARAARADKEWDDQLHGMDYLVYAYLQLARDAEARAAVAEMATVKDWRRPAGGFAMAASPARLMIERRDWSGAAALPVQQSRTPYVQAISHFARALGAARTGNLDAARADVASLGDLAGKLRAAKDAYWAGLVDIQAQIASAWILLAENKHDEALASMRAAADAEDKTEKAPITPGPLAPARELLGDMLLERGMAKEALQAFEQTLAKEPNRYRAFAGAAAAAVASADDTKATTYYRKLANLATQAVAAGLAVERPELIVAQKYTAGK